MNNKGILHVPSWITPRDRVELRPALIEWFRQFADFARHHQIGIHCGKCGGDFSGLNSDHDATFSTSCKCREFVGGNRDYLNQKPPVTQ